MGLLSDRIREIELKSRAILADLVSLVQEPAVAEDPMFQELLEEALKRARRQAGVGKNGGADTTLDAAPKGRV